MTTTTIVCRECQQSFERPAQRGRPPVICEACRAKRQGNVAPTVSPAPAIITKEPVQEIEQSVTQVEEQSNISPSKIEDKKLPLGSFPIEVFCTNLGYVYRSDNKKDAMACYDEYVEKSVAGFGQCGREIVSLFENGILVDRFEPAKELK